MDGIDPYQPGESLYECVECNHRTRMNGHLPCCNGCGGDVRNIAVPRE